MLSPYKSLLIVEDDDNFREIVCWCLREEGYEVHGARNGAEALRVARDVRPEAIVLDLMMPVMDGWELLEQLDLDPALAQIPRFIMTAAPNRNSPDELGAPVFRKPFDVDDLVRAIRDVHHDKDDKNDMLGPTEADLELMRQEDLEPELVRAPLVPRERLN